MENVLKRDRKRTYAKQEDDQDEKGVLLKRFAHQVAGRNPMYCIGKISLVIYCEDIDLKREKLYLSALFRLKALRLDPC